MPPFEHNSGMLQHLKEVLDDPKTYQELIDIAKVFDSGVTNINSYSDQHETVTKITNNKHKKALPLTAYGDGMKKALSLVNYVIKARDGVLLLDELETAIHANALKKVFGWLLKACKKFNVQLIATTHSLEIIDTILEDANETGN